MCVLTLIREYLNDGMINESTTIPTIAWKVGRAEVDNGRLMQTCMIVMIAGRPLELVHQAVQGSYLVSPSQSSF